MGGHLAPSGAGAHFSVWAPMAASVGVVGDFNGWDAAATPLRPLGTSGVWAGFAPAARSGDLYKYRVSPAAGGPAVDHADPYGFAAELPPRTASRLVDLAYAWHDGDWLARRGRAQALDRPASAYEVHLGSWRRVPEEGGRPLTYREAAPLLADHVSRLGFTHVELLPVTEHPFYGSWGYQTTGYFAPTSRYGTPQDLMYLVDTLHQAGIGVWLDWVPSHFPADAFALARFTGQPLYEHPDPRRGVQPDWGSLVFDYGRPEVRSFLLSSALFWLDRYHVDGLRVDAVASMLYRDYSRRPGEWTPNVHGGREHLEAVDFLRQLNRTVYAAHPDVQTVAEESTAWPGVSRPTDMGGLGFGMKWDMGWMHDTLVYFGRDPVHRRHHHQDLTFRALYQAAENFVLPLSHDEVVHGKGSLLGKMPGDRWQRLANLRALLAYMWLTPGKKLLFMGGEFGQETEWAHERSLDWHLMARPEHAGVAALVADLNRLYRRLPALHASDARGDGLRWIVADDADQSVYAFARRAHEGAPEVVCVLNATPVVRTGYRVGVTRPGRWRELLNTDARPYGGSGVGNLGTAQTVAAAAHGQPQCLVLTLPPLAMIALAGPDAEP